MPRKLTVALSDVPKNELLAFKNFNNIYVAKKSLGIKKASEVYKFLLKEYKQSEVGRLTLENKILRIKNQKKDQIIKDYESEKNNYLNILANILEPDEVKQIIQKPKVSYQLINEKRKFDKKALGGLFRELTIEPIGIDQKMDIKTFFIKVHDELSKLYSNKKREGLNFNINLITKYEMESGDNVLTFYFHLPSVETVKNIHFISSYINDYQNIFGDRLDSQLRASDLTFKGINDVKIQISYSKKLKGGSYIETPLYIANKKCCTNVINDDDKCFLWALIASRHKADIKHKDHQNKVKSYNKQEWIDEWKFPKNTDFPYPLNKINSFEKLNNVKINVYDYDGKDITIFYNSRERSEEIIELLQIHGENKTHFLLINNRERLLSKKSEINRNSLEIK